MSRSHVFKESNFQKTRLAMTAACNCKSFTRTCDVSRARSIVVHTATIPARSLRPRRRPNRVQLHGVLGGVGSAARARLPSAVCSLRRRADQTTKERSGLEYASTARVQLRAIRRDKVGASHGWGARWVGARWVDQQIGWEHRGWGHRMGWGTVHGARREHSSVAKGWQRELVGLSFITICGQRARWR